MVWTDISIAHGGLGYDISDFENVDPVFGCLGQVDQLLHALHGRGIRLILDFAQPHLGSPSLVSGGTIVPD
jgi:glycosidase